MDRILNRLTFTVIIFSFLLTSCFSPKGLQYFTEYNKKANSFATASSKVSVLKPFDQIYITVTSYEEFDISMLNSHTNELRVGSTETLYLVGYAINDSGYINYPLAGRVKIADLTLYEAERLIESKLAGFLNSPSVSIRYINRSITILGEVNRPGEIPVTRDQITIFQALGLAGDLTQAGNRKEVTIFRPDGENLHREVINLKDEELLLSDYYYLQPNDIIYVKPTSTAKFRIASSAYTLILTTITTLLLVSDYARP